MSTMQKPMYVPALRLKAGELKALQRLSPDVSSEILPRLIVPPRNDRDQETQLALFTSPAVPAVGSILAPCWQRKPAILDVTYLFDDFGQDESARWLPEMFAGARAAGVSAIPMATVGELLGPRRAGYRSALDLSLTPAFALRVESGDMVGEDFAQNISVALNRLKIGPEKCIIVADFSDASFDQVPIVAEVIDASLQALQELGRWNAIVFQGTNFPNVNPADSGGQVIIQRNEWLAWTKACSFDAETSSQLIFGDFGADCAKFDFSAGGGRAIRHYRYTTPEGWLVVRGKSAGKDKDVMEDVCRRIVNSGLFAGREFSSADDYIFRTAEGVAGPGNSTTWREINTAHHIARVVQDIGTVRGRTFTKAAPVAIIEQTSLF